MALSFPLFPAEFWDLAAISSVEFTLGEAMQISGETGGGQILTAGRGSRLWRGTAQIAPGRHATQDQIMALVDVIREPGASFMVYDPARIYPQHDPDGDIPNGWVCAVSSVNANLREITLKNTPAGFVLTRGDHISIEYGSNPTRYYLGRVVEGDTFVAGTPTTATVELRPEIPTGVTADDTVLLRKPWIKAVYVPGSLKPATRRPVITDGFTFAWRQTLR